LLISLTAVTVVAWLALWAVLAARRWPRSAALPGEGPSPTAGPEPPAVVSLLARGLGSVGYPATLLDLAARGWFRLEAQPGKPMMCVLEDSQPDSELAAYERRAYAQLLARAGDRMDVPAGALLDGLVGPAGAGNNRVKSAKDAFMGAFSAEVIADSRQRGLTRRRLSEPAGCLLWMAALVPAIASGLALHADRSHAYWIPVVGFIVLCAVSGGAVKSEKLTPTGRAALRGWQERCKARAGAGHVPTDARWPDRLDAYATALGSAPPAVKLFSGTPGKEIWSGYGAHWRQIRIGDPEPRTWVQAGGKGLWGLALTMLALLPVTLVAALLAHGELRAAALGVMACDAILCTYLLTGNARTPSTAEFDGQVIEAWTETEVDQERDLLATYPCLAIDDGVRDIAWAFVVTDEQYRRFTPGTLVHAWVNPRRNRLLDISPLTEPRDPRR
jgi:hypothetical protein